MSLFEGAYAAGSTPSIDLEFSAANLWAAAEGQDVLAAQKTLQICQVSCGVVERNTAPIIGDLGPLMGDMSQNGPGVPTTVFGTPSATDNQLPGTPLAWVLQGSDAGNPGVPHHAPTVDPNTGLFSWDVDGSKAGLYKFTYQATDNGLPGNGGPLSDTGLVSVNVIVPEPATMTMIGLALVGCVGLIRRRS